MAGIAADGTGRRPRAASPSDPLAGRVAPTMDSLDGRGLWMANQLCELVQIRSFPDGGSVRVHKRLG